MSDAGARIETRWISPGPVSTAFMKAERDVELLNGPIGAGKTRTVFAKTIRRLARQKPSTKDGIRKFKLCVVHSNYRQLWRSTLPSWWKLMPKDQGEFTGAENAPAKHIVNFDLAGKPAMLWVDFVAIGDNAVEDVMRGYEPTAFFLNELDLLAEDVYTFARGRVGRYPDMSDGGPDWYGIMADCNAPTLSSWLYQHAFLDKPLEPEDPQSERFSDYGVLFRQPGAREPGAENLKNLPKGYYEKQARGQKAWYIARMIDNKPGYSRAGKPVYPEFNDALHVAQEPIAYIPTVPLLIGADAGGSPAAAFGQRLPGGRTNIIDELVTEQGTGPVRFSRLLLDKLAMHYPGAFIRAWADPSSMDGGDKQSGAAEDQAWLDIVRAETGIAFEPTDSNLLTKRLKAVSDEHEKMPDGHPAYQLSPKCVMLREGKNSGYRYRKIVQGDTTRYSEEPEKNEYSHIADAEQYLLLGASTASGLTERRGEQFARVRNATHVHDWDPYAQGG